jgi:NADH:ubiquinone oxidoreductase subunit 4 (subunit M)
MVSISIFVFRILFGFFDFFYLIFFIRLFVFVFFFELGGFYFGGIFFVDSLSFFIIFLCFYLFCFCFFSSFNETWNNNYGSSFFFVLGFIFFFVFLRFFVFNIILFYVFFEFIFILMFVFLLNWGRRPERLQASFYIIFYTMVVSFPFLVFLFIFRHILVFYKFVFFACMGGYW